jgi:hypothetical protein
MGLLPDINIPVPEPVDKIANVIGSEGFWKRTGVIVIGVFLVIVGTVIMVSGAKAVKDIGNAALAVGTKVVTKGAV